MIRNGDIEYLRKYLSSFDFEKGVQLLEQGISPQYIVGNVDFYGYSFHVDSNVLIPRFETELLVEKTISYIRYRFDSKKCINILDIGTGSGCIAVILKKKLNCYVKACDISLGALDVARKNALDNDAQIEFVCSDVYSNIYDKFDVIVSNPPYIRNDEKIEEIVKNNEPHIALYGGKDGLDFYRKILKDVNCYLKNNFMIAFEIGEFQGKSVSDLAYHYLKDISVVVEKDYSGRDRFVFIFSM